VSEAHRWYEHLISLWAPGVIEAAFDLGVFTALAEGAKTGGASCCRARLRARCNAHAAERAVRLRSPPARYGKPRHTGLRPASRSERMPAAWRPVQPGRQDSLRPGIGLECLAQPRGLGAHRSGEKDGSERLNQICSSDYVDTIVQGINFWAPPVVNILATALEERGWAAGGPKVILDVGCGTGLYSQLLLQRYPFLSAVGLDEQRIIPMTIAQSERLGVASRFKAVVCDFHEDEWDGDFDLILISNIFHLQTHESAQVLASKVGQALGEGGHVAIVDHIIEVFSATSIRPGCG
jgi:Methyltransferase domain